MVVAYIENKRNPFFWMQSIKIDQSSWKISQKNKTSIHDFLVTSLEMK